MRSAIAFHHTLTAHTEALLLDSQLAAQRSRPGPTEGLARSCRTTPWLWSARRTWTSGAAAFEHCRQATASFRSWACGATHCTFLVRSMTFDMAFDTHSAQPAVGPCLAMHDAQKSCSAGVGKDAQTPHNGATICLSPGLAAALAWRTHVRHLAGTVDTSHGEALLAPSGGATAFGRCACADAASSSSTTALARAARAPDRSRP